jgi:hypothetical protein
MVRAMSQGSDFWYVRLPDGRVFRAATTNLLRQEVGAGRIPLGSTVRRTPSEEWVALEWTREFSDLVEHPESPTGTPPAREQGRQTAKASNLADRLDPHRLQMVGVKGLLLDLLSALDSTLTAPKLLTTAFAGLVIGIVATIIELRAIDLGSYRWNTLLFWVTVLVVLCVPMALLTRLTYVELSQLRPSRWREGLRGAGQLIVRLIITFGLVAASCWGLIVLFRLIPSWLVPPPDALLGWLWQAAAGAALAAGMAFEVALWAILGVSLLLPSLLVVEKCSIVSALRQWLALIREHLGRLFLFEALATAAGLLVSLPFAVLLLPVTPMSVDLQLPLPPMYVHPQLSLAALCARNLLAGLAGALFMAYLIVANTFIYLHLRYHSTSRE